MLEISSVFFFDTENINIINNNDILLCVDIIHEIIDVEFTQIKRLTQYLNNIAKVCNILDVNIYWNLSRGLYVKQGYLFQHSERIPLVNYNKRRITIKYTDDQHLDKNKQVVSLIPNLIHSLDTTSLMLLYEKFFSINKSINKNISVFTVHDYFATTCNKVYNLLMILRSIYTNLYSKEPYLHKFDECIISNIFSNYGDNIE